MGVTGGVVGGFEAQPARTTAKPVNSKNLRVIGLNFLAQIVKNKT